MLTNTPPFRNNNMHQSTILKTHHMQVHFAKYRALINFQFFWSLTIYTNNIPFNNKSAEEY